MFIETTFLRYGHGASGLIGKTLNENAVHRWGMKSQTTEHSIVLITCIGVKGIPCGKQITR